MDETKPFGKELTKENYPALRKLAQHLSYKDFHDATGFAHGIHNRLRRFSALEEYKNYVEESRRKYPRERKETITHRDVYQKLIDIEKILKEK